jgi:hypothetical protein
VSRGVWAVLSACFILSAGFSGCSFDHAERKKIEASPSARNPAAPTNASPSIRIIPAADSFGPATFEVAGLSSQILASLAEEQPGSIRWAGLFAVYVDGGGSGLKQALPAVNGTYRVEQGLLRFIPQFPLQPGLRYRAILKLPQSPKPGPEADGKQNGAAWSETIASEFTLPARPVVATARVVNVYPTTNALPENQLKFYIHFSAPMSRGQAYQHVQLLNAAGQPIYRPFLELGEELWDRDGTRFTLFFDPGRVKRGLRPREDLGQVLEDGKRYTLVIDQRWQDAEGNPLKSSHRKNFRVSLPDVTSPDPKTWKVAPPRAGTQEPVTVSFPEPLDHALLLRLLKICDAKGQVLTGRTEVTDGERRWIFTPASAWRDEQHSLVITTTLEDLAGNSVGRPFEVDVFPGVQRRIEVKTVALAIQVKPGKSRK